MANWGIKVIEWRESLQVKPCTEPPFPKRLGDTVDLAKQIPDRFHRELVTGEGWFLTVR